MKNWVLREWGALCAFAKREGLPCISFFALGIAFGAATRLLFADKIFRQVLLAKYGHPPKVVDSLDPYALYALTIAGAIVLVVLLKSSSLLTRALRSWSSGVCSGLSVVSFISALLFCATEPLALRSRVLWSIVCFLSGCLVSFVLHRKAISKSGRPADLEGLRVGKELSNRKIAPVDFDEPIDAWEDDLLDRTRLVEIISIKLLVAMKPVIALNGKFGVGKTSLLNLLRRHLKDKAIVVSFSTWLPGSDETFVKYLLSDIVAECRKQYIVPGLRQGSLKLANALAKSVPYLTGVVELLPASTQRDDIDGLKRALRRLPKRVVVLLDEIDRMQPEEIISLLKMLRGVSALPNLSFVCALDVDKIVGAAKLQGNQEQREYFEKFFVEVIPVSQPEPETLNMLGVQALVRSFEQAGWFVSKEEKIDLQTKLEKLWDGCIEPFCTNLRKIGLLANDVHGTAALLQREVNPIDLVLVQVLRRYEPTVYELVSKNALTLSGQFNSVRNYRYVSDAKKKQLEKNLVKDIDLCSKEPDEKECIERILSELFPLYRGLDGRSNVMADTVRDTPEKDMGIRNPAMFQAYFRYDLPRDVFSATELERILDLLNQPRAQKQAEAVLASTLDSMEPGSGKREDFLRKLSLASASMHTKVGEPLAFAAMECADRYVYDSNFGLFGESHFGYRILASALLKMEQPDRLRMVRECIRRTTDDSMAFGLLAKLTDRKNLEKQGGDSLYIPASELYGDFILRMRTRFGKDVDASDPRLIMTSDRHAFNYWGMPQPPDGEILVDPEDRRIQESFWIRHIGTSKKVLAETSDRFFFPMMHYLSDPSQFVENFISIERLRKIYEEATDEAGLTKAHQGALRRLLNLLEGKYVNAVPMDEWQQ